jgi:hypothetical protein
MIKHRARQEKKILQSRGRSLYRAVFCFCVFIFVITASGCIVVPFIDSVRQVGATKSHRMDLLNKEIERFQVARFWQDMSTALSHVKENERANVKKYFLEKFSSARVVSHKIMDVEFTTDAFEASVEVQTRLYEPASPQVVTQNEIQEWIFSLSDGWKVRLLRPQEKTT